MPGNWRLSLPGTITEVIYLGTSTRLLVELPTGQVLTVLEQNASTRSTDDRRGESVVARFAADRAERVAFYEFLQWQAAEQLAALESGS